MAPHLHAEEWPAAELGPEDVEDVLSFPPVLVGKELKREEEPHADAEGGHNDHGCDVEETSTQHGEDMAAKGLCLGQGMHEQGVKQVLSWPNWVSENRLGSTV